MNAVLLLALIAQGDFSKVEIKATKVAGNVYMLEGAGGNIGVSVGDDGIAIVDDQFAPLADKIRAALKGISKKPVRFVINTHWHFDHVGGNEKFGKESTILAHENVRARMLAGAPAKMIGQNQLPPTPPAAKQALPLITFTDRATIHFNGEDIRALHVPKGHTDGDSVVFFTKSNVVHMGDSFVTYGFPFIDLESGGSVKGFIANLDRLIPEIPAGAKIIPGHGGVSTIDDVKKFTAILKEIVAAVEAELKKGTTLEQMKQKKLLAKWEPEWGTGFIKADDFLGTVYADLTKK
jgi:cyclase